MPCAMSNAMELRSFQRRERSRARITRSRLPPSQNSTNMCTLQPSTEQSTATPLDWIGIDEREGWRVLEREHVAMLQTTQGFRLAKDDAFRAKSRGRWTFLAHFQHHHRTRAFLAHLKEYRVVDRRGSGRRPSPEMQTRHMPRLIYTSTLVPGQEGFFAIDTHTARAMKTKTLGMNHALVAWHFTHHRSYRCMHKHIDAWR
jgi:hypothetical protein